MRRAGILAGLLALALAGAAAAQTTISGVVKNVDQGTRVIELEDGRLIRLDDRTVILADARQMQLSALEPGTTVIVATETPAVAESSTLPPARPRAATFPVTGTVARVDAGTQTIVLSDGRVIQAGPNTVVIMYDRPVELARVTAGDRIVVRYGEPVAADVAALVRNTERAAGGAAVIRRGGAAFNPGRVEPWPAGVPESELLFEPQAP